MVDVIITVMSHTVIVHCTQGLLLISGGLTSSLYHTPLSQSLSHMVIVHCTQGLLLISRTNIISIPCVIITVIVSYTVIMN